MSADILIVDDESEMREALNEALCSFGFNVSLACDGGEGLELFSNNSYSLVITDVKMPKINGIELLQEIRKKNSKTPVIIITAYGAIDNAVEAMKFGAVDYMLKPFSADLLEETVNNALKGTPNQRPAASADYSKSRKKFARTDLKYTDPAMRPVVELARDIAPSASTVLIQGESGTGKEVLAKFIHANSNRADGPFVAVNCAALPKDLLESELFGHEKGSFTGAFIKKIGKFELANNGTILLDEITEMELSLQAKLLRVLQEHEVDRVGGSRPVQVNMRVIATTNRDIKEAVAKREFREDLYYRLAVIPITIPSLRERKGDIIHLANFFIEKHSSISSKKITGLSKEAEELLNELLWPGNVRELENVIERGVLLCKGNELSLKDLMLGERDQPKAAGSEVNARGSGQTVSEMERDLILSTLRDSAENRTHAAERLGISIRTLRNKLNEYKDQGFL